MATCKDCLNEKDCPYRMGEAELISVNDAVYENAEDLDKVNDVEALCQLFKDKNSYAKVKHGKWFKSLGGAYFCSNCGMNATYDFSKNQVLGVACTHCGIKIDGKEVGSD